MKEEFLLSVYRKSVHKTSVKELLFMLSEEINNPVMLVDANLRVLVSTEQKPIEDDRWNRMLGDVQTRYELSKQCQKNGLIHAIEKNAASQILDLPDMEHKMINCTLNWEGNVLGYLAVLEYDSVFQEEELELLDEFAAIISRLLRYDLDDIRVRNFGFTQVMMELLGNKEIPEQILARYDFFSGLSGDTLFYVLTIEREEGASAISDYMSDILENQISGLKIIAFKSKMVGLLKIKHDKYREESFQKLKDWLKSYQMECGVSTSFKEICGLSGYEEESRRGLVLGRRFDEEKVIYPYEDYKMLDMLEQLSASCGLQQFVSSDVKRLVEYDREYGTDFFRDLCCYVKAGYDMKKAAVNRNVHINTMYYRISKTEQILKCDLKESGNRFKTELSIYILEYLNTFK